MIKKIVLSTLLLSGLLQAQILDAKQVLIKQLQKCKKKKLVLTKAFMELQK